MAQDYWIDEVGGLYQVGYDLRGRAKDWFEDGDKDYNDEKMSTLADVEALWDKSEDETVGGPFDLSAGLRSREKVQSLIKDWEKKEGKVFRSKKKSGGFFGDIVHGLNTVASLPSSAVKATLGKIPGIGGPIQAAVNMSPERALGGLASRVASGERLDRAFLNVGKEQIKNARQVAPYVQTAMSFVPGVGTGVAAAIAAGTALAEGRTISDAVLSAARGALPGGPLATAAFDTALAVTQGQRLDKVALNTALRQLPPNVQRGVRTAMSAASGKNIKDVVLQEVRKNLPPEARKALEMGTALGSGRTIQSGVVREAGKKENITRLAKTGARLMKRSPKKWQKKTKGLSRTAKAGFMAGMGAGSRSGNNAHALAKMRSRLGSSQRRGFDHAMKSLANEANPKWKSLVRGGVVTRGDWKKSRRSDRGAVAPGRVVQGVRVLKGMFSR